MIILSLETSTHVCSVALHQNGSLLSFSETLIEKSHAEKITSLIEQVCLNAKIELKSIDAIAISRGPGSYTGLRIASSTAKGLCFAFDKPLIAVDTLQSMASQISRMGLINTADAKNYFIYSMLDARRMEVFTAKYDVNAQRVSEFEAKIIDENSFAEELETQKLIFCGNGAEKCKTTITHKNAIFLDHINPNAAQIGFLATELYNLQSFADVVNFEPFYLKEFYMAMPKPK